MKFEKQNKEEKKKIIEIFVDKYLDVYFERIDKEIRDPRTSI